MSDKYGSSNFEVNINRAKSCNFGKRFNGKTYLRIELEKADFGIAYVDLCFDDLTKAQRWFSNVNDNIKKFEE